jgi:hypothetical protein
LKEIEHYTQRVAPQHKKPKFLKWLAANLKAVTAPEKIMLSYDREFDIDNAAGVQLDMLGEIVGRSRILSFQPADGSDPDLDDDMYRILIKAKISQNHWDGTIPGMYELWKNLFPEYHIFIQDNMDMTMTVYLDMHTPIALVELIENDYIVPRPQGVGLKLWIMIIEEYTNTDYQAGAISEIIEEYYESED